MKLSLENKYALVCGSTSGIGEAIAIELAKLGATITLLARNEDKLKKVLQKLPTTTKENHNYAVADFANTQQAQETVERLCKERKYHILINNTGGPKGGPIINAATQEFTNGFKMHLVANQILTQAVVPSMKEASYGRIINIISTSVKQPIDGLGVSNTIRGAVASWSKTMANELGPHGITVNNVLPGFTATPRLASIISTRSKREDKSEEDVIRAMKSIVPARRFAKPEEVAYAAAFLASPAAQYINGVNLPVDGGRTKSL